MIDTVRRRAFAAFLIDLSNGMASADDWYEYAVNHYFDETLETIRCCCVRFAQEAGPPFPRTEEQKRQLREWAVQLGRS